MEKLVSALNNLVGADVRVSNDKVHQVQARTIKQSVLNAIKNDLNANGFTVGDIEKGFIVKVGEMTLNFDVALKPLSYDFEIAVQDELDRQAEIKSRKAKTKKVAK
jgi:hypothetical protein